MIQNSNVVYYAIVSVFCLRYCTIVMVYLLLHYTSCRPISASSFLLW